MFNYCQKGDGLKAGDGVSSKIIEESGGGGVSEKKLHLIVWGLLKIKLTGPEGGL